VSARARVLVVDDEVQLCQLLEMRLTHHGYAVVSVHTARDALDRVTRESFDVVVLDLRLPDGEGLDVLAELKRRTPDLPVLMLTAHGTIEAAVEAMRRGAYGFLTKPFHDHDLLEKLAHAVERNALKREIAGLRRIVGDPGEVHILGTSAAIDRVRALIARVSAAEVTVLITGESGTGKELVARALHAHSPRSRGPFVAVNCAALPAELLESELFGYVRGAFTGANRDKEGLFAAANESTLFLDEIGDAPLPVQAKLLRVLQERRYTPIGSNVEREADVRLVAATNRDLRADVASGRFREDLFFRLHVVPIELPALRERREDVPVLAEVFLERAAARHGVPVPRFGRSAIDAMLAHDWPGNVRELANVVEATVLLAGTTEIGAEHLHGLLQTTARPTTTTAAAPPEEAEPVTAAGDWSAAALFKGDVPLPTLKEAREQLERAYLEEVLRRAGGNVAAAARAAGRNRTDFYDLLRRYGLSAAEFKG
jgi:two-component system response regulator GlrR